jgi:hypothetical protein
MLLPNDSFLNLSCQWSETPHFLNDSWQITVAEQRYPLKIAVSESGELISPCTISMYEAKPIEKIEIFAFTNSADNEGDLETVSYDQAILFNCAGARTFCVGCMLDDPGMAEYLHFSEDQAVIENIVDGSSIRLVLE